MNRNCYNSLKMCEVRKKRAYYLLTSAGLEIVELNFEILISNDFNIIYASFVTKTTSSLQVIITNRKLKIFNWKALVKFWFFPNHSKRSWVYIGSKSFQLKRFGHIWHSFKLFLHLAAFKNDLSTQCFSQISIGCDNIGGTRFQVFKDCLKLIIFNCSFIRVIMLRFNFKE